MLTLIELVVVVGIVLILVALVTSSFSSIVLRSEAAKTETAMQLQRRGRRLRAGHREQDHLVSPRCRWGNRVGGLNRPPPSNFDEASNCTECTEMARTSCPPPN